MPSENQGSETLSGARIVVTRAENDQKGLISQLEKLGATVFSIPSISRRPLLLEPDLINLLSQIQKCDWVIFTSPFAVQVLENNSFPLAKACEKTKVAAVGPSTEKALEQNGVIVDCIPVPHTWHHFAEYMGNLKGSSICLPRSQKGAVEFPEMLRSLGATVFETWTYNTVPNCPDYTSWIPLKEKIDYILFTSGTTVKGFQNGLEAHGLQNTIANTNLTCIGPSTASACMDLFGRADLIAQPHTEGGLINALINHINLENYHE